MPHATTLPPGTVQANINYYNETLYGPKGKVWLYMAAHQRRQIFDPRVMPIADIRDTNEDFDVDTSGFKLVTFPQLEIPLEDDRECIMKQVWPVAEEVYKKHTGATSVQIFSHTIRNEPHQTFEDIRNSDDPDDKLIVKEHPAMLAHCGKPFREWFQSGANTLTDQSYKGGYYIMDDYKVNRQDSGSLEALEKKCQSRWAIVNLWKPLKPITREPLAVCDARSVDESDLSPNISRVPAELHPSGKCRDSEYWQVVANDKHKWYWASNMGTDEAWLIKCFDTKVNGVARRALHTAFQTPNDHGPPRISIEFRAFVFWEDQERE
ncbi:Hydroxylase/desaturase asaB [Pseudocercospora fuligena]|uniref:Hydroxylase/desaturase asaB n=1 Tax=Pseudocercospora fuligena TaxID=685502 RepID=A0A8H6R9V1_9PEZI|nr:Hydroxylase/desaturase asaB [Pseudocercospora fuligena]